MKYLQVFPDSSHRKLLDATTHKKKVAPKEEKEETPEINNPIVRTKVIIRAAKGKPRKIKRRNDKKENTLPVPVTFDHDVKLKRHPLPHAGRVSTLDSQPTEKEVRAIRVAEHEQVKREVATLNRDGAAVINPHSVKAVSKIEQHHLAIASQDIDKRRHEIRDVVGERIQEHPKLFNRGLKALGKVFNGAKKLTPKDMHSAKRVLTQIAMVALLATSALAISMGAAPLAVVSSRMLFDIWMRNHKRKKDGFLKPKQPKPIEEKPEKEVGPTEVKPRKPKDSDWRKEDAEDAKFTSVSGSFSMAEDHEYTIDNVLNQLSDLFKHQDVSEFKELNENMFGKIGNREAATASTYENTTLYVTMYNAVAKLATNRLYGTPGQLLYGQFYVGINEIIEIVERILQVSPEVELEDGQTVFHFLAGDSLLTVGTANDIIYFAFTERS